MISAVLIIIPLGLFVSLQSLPHRHLIRVQRYLQPVRPPQSGTVSYPPPLVHYHCSLHIVDTVQGFHLIAHIHRINIRTTSRQVVPRAITARLHTIINLWDTVLLGVMIEGTIMDMDRWRLGYSSS